MSVYFGTTEQTGCPQRCLPQKARHQPRSTGLSVNGSRVSLAPGVAGARLMTAISLAGNIIV